MNNNIDFLHRSIKALTRSGLLFSDFMAGETNLPHGLDGEKIRIGFCGAVSSGKTTSTAKTIQASAGSISSGPTTACLVVHRYSNTNTLSFDFNDVVQFTSQDTSTAFDEFLTKNNLRNNFSQKKALQWEAQGVKQATLMCSIADAMDIMAQVNEFGLVFKTIYWNHKDNVNRNPIMDLINIYDFPSIAGPQEIENRALNALEYTKLDMLIYLVDTVRGVPGKDEIHALESIQNFLKNNPSCKFFWAYEKEANNTIEPNKALKNIHGELKKYKEINLDYLNGEFLNLTGKNEIDQNESFLATMWFNALKPYYISIGEAFYNKTFAFNAAETKEQALINSLSSTNSNAFLISVLHEIEKKIKNTPNTSRQDLHDFILTQMGLEKGTCTYRFSKNSLEYVWGSFQKNLKKVFQDQEKDTCTNLSSLDIVQNELRDKISTTVDNMIDMICSSEKASMDKLLNLISTIHNHPEICAITYYVQQYLILKEHGNFYAYFHKDAIEKLRSNFRNTLDDLKSLQLEGEGENNDEYE